MLRSNVLHHHFYLPKVITQVQTGLEYSAGHVFKPVEDSIAILDLYYLLRSKVLHRHFYLPKVIIQVLNGNGAQQASSMSKNA